MLFFTENVTDTRNKGNTILSNDKMNSVMLNLKKSFG